MISTALKVFWISLVCLSVIEYTARVHNWQGGTRQLKRICATIYEREGDNKDG